MMIYGTTPDNPPVHHTLLLVQNVLAKNNNIVISQPSYSPGVTHVIFFLFQKLKTITKGQRFTIVECKTKITKLYQANITSVFQKRFEARKNISNLFLVS